MPTILRYSFKFCLVFNSSLKIGLAGLNLHFCLLLVYDRSKSHDQSEQVGYYDESTREKAERRVK